MPRSEALTEMAGERKTDRNARAAVAYAHRLATSAGLMWHEMTGQDIGIDAIIEIPCADEEADGSRGFVLVQIKSRAGARRRDRLSAVYKKRHHLYWLTQRLPVVLCIVEPIEADGLSAAGSGHWIDYKSLTPGDRDLSISSSRDGRRSTLHVRRDNPHVWSPRSAHGPWHAEARSFRRWIEGVVVRPAEAIAAAATEAADHLLGSGKPDQARRHLNELLPPSEAVLLSSDSRGRIENAIARSYRRLGAVADQKRRMAAYRKRGDQVPGFMQHELALTHWTRASMTPLPGNDPSGWHDALRILGRPQPGLPKQAPRLKLALIRAAAFINIRAGLACVSCKRGDAPTTSDMHHLKRLLGSWTTSRSAQRDEGFHRHRLNALRALCRGHLARADLVHAVQTLKTLDRLMTARPDRDLLSVTDMLLLSAWASLEAGDTAKARGILECARHLLNTMHDPLLKGLMAAIERRGDAPAYN